MTHVLLVSTHKSVHLIGELVKTKPGFKGQRTALQVQHNCLLFQFEGLGAATEYIITAVALSSKTGLCMIQLADLLTLEDLGWHPRRSFVRSKKKK